MELLSIGLQIRADLRFPKSRSFASPGFATPIALMCDRGPRRAPLRMTILLVGVRCFPRVSKARPGAPMVVHVDKLRKADPSLTAVAQDDRFGCVGSCFPTQAELGWGTQLYQFAMHSKLPREAVAWTARVPAGSYIFSRWRKPPVPMSMNEKRRKLYVAWTRTLAARERRPRRTAQRTRLTQTRSRKGPRE